MAIAPIVGVTYDTVQRDIRADRNLSPVSDDTPEPKYTVRLTVPVMALAHRRILVLHATLRDGSLYTPPSRKLLPAA